MNNKGITYFRLNSPYEGDITKNCALDGYEVDNNFLTLEGRDIKAIYVRDNEIEIELINGQLIKSGDVFSSFAQDLDIEFDTENGILYVTQNGETKAIEGFVTGYGTKGAVATDSTLLGSGKPSNPLSLSPLYKPGVYRPVKKFIDLTVDTDCNHCGCPQHGRIEDSLPDKRTLLPGDRFLVRTENSDYGFLYNYEGVKKIACDLNESHSEWRIPTKEDWDDLLNAIEPCAEDKTHSSASSNMWLGRLAGKFLKSKYLWRPEGCPCNENGNNNSGNSNTCFDYGDDANNEGTNSNNCVNNCSCGRPETECDPMHCGEYHSCHHRPKKHGHGGLDVYGFGVTPAGYADDGGMYGYFGERGMFWTATVSRSGASSYAKRFDYNKSSVYQDIVPTTLFLSIRLVKDYTGDNFFEREDILTDNYPTVLMPSASKGHKVWTSVNVALSNRCYEPMIPNDGNGMTMIKKYFIYEWDGRTWITNEMREGEIVTIMHAPNGKHSIPYKLVNHELIDLNLRTVNAVLHIIHPKLENLEHLINVEKERAIAAEERLEAAIDSTTSRLENEILERQAADEALNNKIDNETAQRIAADEALTAALEQEAQARADKDAEIEANLNAEIEARQAKDAEHDQAIADEIAARIAADEEEKAAREAKDAELEQAIADEAAAREAKDTELEQAIADETAARIAADEEEKAAREAKDAELEQAIADEAAAREAKDAELEQSIADEAAARIAADEEEKAAREAKDEEIEGKLLTAEGTEFDKDNGVLTLKSAAGTNDITVQFSFNFGEI